MDSRSGASQARPTVAELTETLRAALTGTRFRQLDWVAETGSTNRDLLDEVTSSAPGRSGGARVPAVLVTDHQTAGRGTKGRSWFDPPGGSLLLSVRLFPELAPNRLHLLVMALSVAASDACRQVAGVSIGLKWPNDLFVEDRKLAGVLTESSMRGGRVEALVIGIGLNVNWPAEVPVELGELAVALNQLAGTDIDRAQLAIALIGNFEAELRALDTPGGEADLFARYRARSATLGRQVRLELPDGPLLGEAVDLTDEGHLVVLIDGQRRSFAAVDVTHLRLR